MWTPRISFNGSVFGKLQWIVLGADDGSIAWYRLGGVLVDLWCRWIRTAPGDTLTYRGKVADVAVEIPVGKLHSHTGIL